MTSQNLDFRAGREAYASIRRHGFAVEHIGSIAGASGGAKWLVLSQLDRVVTETIAPRLHGPVHLIGSSIGAWRFACYAQSDPLAAIERFEDAYIDQTYSDKPDIAEITNKTREILCTVLGDRGTEEILGNPLYRLHVIVVRARHVAAMENRLALAAGLITAATLNAISRRSLGLFFERALFSDSRDPAPFDGLRGFPLQRANLSAENLIDVITASGAIPLVISGVADITGAKPGMYRDGGIIDYHLDLPHSEPGRYALYPHFYDHLVPGWFDKRLSWRRPDPVNVERTIVISPSAAFVARLPRAKIPDRTDFRTYAPRERMRAWRRVVQAAAALADEFHEVLERDLLAARLERL